MPPIEKCSTRWITFVPPEEPIAIDWSWAAAQYAPLAHIVPPTATTPRSADPPEPEGPRKWYRVVIAVEADDGPGMLLIDDDEDEDESDDALGDGPGVAAG